LNLPFLSPGQAQKEFFHNEALQTLDIAVCAAVEEPPRPDPPASPTTGSCYLVGQAPTGSWSGKSGCIAAYTSGGWRFVDPIDGLTVFVRSNGLAAVRRQGEWEIGTLRAETVAIGEQQVVGARQAAVPNPAGGVTIDSEARAAVAAVLDRLRTHGLIES
jgi:hypothetical protein